MKALAFTVSFLLAFLLFGVQPMATKMVLPTLGGTPAVWNTDMFLFQLLLLGGYAYAHWLTQLCARRQRVVHGGMVLASLLVLPLSVTLVGDETLYNHPIAGLIRALLLQLGLPFFVLAATAPLLQSWVSRSSDPLAKTPYVLYSASNLGSMFGLIGYVVLVEPFFALPQQTIGWSALYFVGTSLLLVAGWKLLPKQNSAATHALPKQADSASAKPGVGIMLLWVWLAFLPSSLSLGVTSYITTDIAAVPLLWVLPLSIYLLSFVDAFREKPLLVKPAIRIAPMAGMLALMFYGFQGHQFSEVFIFQLVVFAVMALALHGWLARFKPPATQLTRFYFCLSIGGALGGLLNALVAPLLFTEVFEFPISLLLASLTAFLLWQRSSEQGRVWLKLQLWSLARIIGSIVAMSVVFYLIYAQLSGVGGNGLTALDTKMMMSSASLAALVSLLLNRRFAQAFYALIAIALVMLLAMSNGVIGMDTMYKKRNFFGLLRVYDDPAKNARYMMHNTTLHGVQELKLKGKPQPLSYYVPLREAFNRLSALRSHPAAVVGMGAGTLQCMAQENQRFDYVEINPLVVELAENPEMFRYLSACPGKHKVYLGDGRVLMAQRPDGEYGAIVLDAFSSDAVPSHLLTREALAMYIDKLAPHGVLLINTTNRHIDLWPLLGAQAESLGGVAYGRSFAAPADQKLVYSSFWVIMARQQSDIDALVQDEGWVKLQPDPGAKPWTDEFVNILPYFKMLRK